MFPITTVVTRIKREPCTYKLTDHVRFQYHHARRKTDQETDHFTKRIHSQQNTTERGYSFWLFYNTKMITTNYSATS